MEFGEVVEVGSLELWSFRRMVPKVKEKAEFA
jgi:hypothetical protein